MPTTVTVVRDGGILARGYRDGDANQPVIFPEHQRGWWYCDLVRVADNGDTVHVDDHWIDVIVGPPDHPYRVLDLDEYADAIESGDLDAAAGVDGLRRTQMFLDRHLNRRHDTRRDSWPDFPPRAIAALSRLPTTPRWEALDK